MDPTKLLDDEPGLASPGAMLADDEVNAPTHVEIADLAYQYWESRGGQGGSPWEDWFRAEGELKRRVET
jgi:Protein of unknown function (DUF2934)